MTTPKFNLNLAFKTSATAPITSRGTGSSARKMAKVLDRLEIKILVDKQQLIRMLQYVETLLETVAYM